MNRGIWYGIAAYGTWGFFPIYFKWLQQVPAAQVVSHRVVWSCLILLAIIFLTRQWKKFRASAFTPRSLRTYTIVALLIGVNWLVWVQAVSTGHIVDVSLGQFITPLINVLLGVIVLREHLRRWQWLAVGMAATGLLYLTISLGAPPWIALLLGVTFGFYGLIKKTAPLGSLHGLTVETGILAPVALIYLLVANSEQHGAFLHTGALADMLLVGSGLITMVPLLLFASAARRVPLTTMGVLQYITPTIQFLLGVLVYGEPFSHHQLLGFGLVWLALVVFAIDGFRSHRLPPVLDAQ